MKERATDQTEARRLQMVVPAYNEAGRWDWDFWREALVLPGIEWIFVNDGSTDGTQAILDQIEAEYGHRNLPLQPNRGKSEAVRLGMLDALGTGEDTDGLVGFLDADGSVSAEEVDRITRLVRFDRVASFDSLWAARVDLSGRHIRRNAARHYIGRVVATVLTVGYPDLPYDSQCGFKIFDVSPTLVQCFSRPFKTRWFVDVEILQNWRRITGSSMRVWEEPLLWWEDQGGSHITPGGYVNIIRDMSSVIGQGRALYRKRAKG